MGERERSLGERAQEHDKSVKEGASKSVLIQIHVKTGHVVIRESRKLFTSSFKDPSSTEQEGMTCLTFSFPG